MDAILGMISNHCIISAQGHAFSGSKHPPQSLPLYCTLSHIKAVRHFIPAGSEVLYFSVVSVIVEPMMILSRVSREVGVRPAQSGTVVIALRMQA